MIESPVDEIRLHSRVIAGLRFAQFYIPGFFFHTKAAALSGFFSPRNSLSHACGEIIPRATHARFAHRYIPTSVGTSTCPANPRPRRRFIPTCVRNIQRSSNKTRTEMVHPHACGEQLFTTIHAHRFPGTSPRLWGTGKRPSYHRHTGPVHPHRCGEHCG